MRRPRASMIAFFLFCLCFSWGFAELILHVNSKRIISMVFHETRQDDNGDGINDTYTATFNNGKSWEISSMVADMSFDGVPDTYSFFSEKFNASFVIQQHMGDLNPDVQFFEISDQRQGGTRHWRYYDLDVDGDIDFMKSLTTDEGRLPIGNTWYPFLVDRGGNFNDGFWIYISSDWIVHAHFDRDKGIWEIDDEGNAAQ